MNNPFRIFSLLVGLLFTVQSMAAQERQEASTFTKEANQVFYQTLPFNDKEDFNRASHLLISKPDALNITSSNGELIWSLDDFLKFETPDAKAPDTVNPSLWRMALLNMNDGLFEVVPRVYQVRGFDISVMSIIDAGKGYVVIDPLISAETAKAGMDEFYKKHPPKPILAVIYTHSHVDHFGGVRGIVDEKDVQNGKVKIIAPQGFLEHAISENVMAGTAMSRRATYMYGSLLPKDAKGNVDAGLGKGTSSGTLTLIPPTVSIDKTAEKIKLGDLNFIFQLTPDTEAPSEMNFFIPELNALCMAENITHTLHNLYSLRGAQVRDAVSWVKHINESIKLFGNKAQVVFSSHHWPTWGQEEILALLEIQRDAYKYIHDETLRLANQGYTMTEIAEMIELPPALQNVWADREYYGTVNHNVKAVYQRYLGWFDGNPSNLHPLPPVETSKNRIAYMGGSAEVMKKAQVDYDKGNYRWVAQVLNDVVFAEPDNQAARHLLANTLEQLGYQSESGPWRNFYLTGAQELRYGVKDLPAPNTASPDVVAAMPLDMIFDYLAIRLNGPKANDLRIEMNWIFPDTKQQYRVLVNNSVLNYFPEEKSDKADVTITLNRQKINDLILGIQTFDQAKADGSVKVEGDAAKLTQFFELLDKFNFWFNIVTP